MSDFQRTKSALGKLLEARGHIILFGVKCPPEMAGGGIEYLWGVSKKYFRNHNYGEVKKLREKVERALSFDERRARDYMNVYRGLTVDAGILFSAIEKHKNIQKTHRNVGELDHEFIDAELEAIEKRMSEIQASRAFVVDIV